jgi:hypothetical protein
VSELIDFVQLRAEYVSLGLVFLVLYASAGAVARLIGAERDRVSDLFFSGTIAFVVAGRLWWLAAQSPGSLIDPLVLVQVQTGLEPLAGAAGVLLLASWQTRGRRDEMWLALPVVGAGLALATVVYDGACPLRDACYGAPAPAPWGFRMSGLADTRLATPLIEAAIIMLALGALVRSLPVIGERRAGMFLLAALALTRAALTPLSVFERDAVGLETAILAVAAAGLVAALAVRLPEPPRLTA